MKLLKDEFGNYYTELEDEEGNMVTIRFNYEDCAFIETDNLNYLIINSDDLFELAEMVIDADYLYRERLKKEKE